MKYFYENDIVKQGWANYAQLNRSSARPINVRFCRDCPYFDINGIQPDKGVIHGICLRLSDDAFHHYIRVKDSSFCNEDDINEGTQFCNNFTYHYIGNLA